MNPIKIRSVKYNFLMNLVLTGSSVFFPLITFPLVSRALHSDMYGLCSWSFSVVSWLSLIAMLGVNRYGIREVARARDDASVLAKTTIEILALTLTTSSIVLACFIASIFVVPDFAEQRELFLINSLSILGNTLGVGWFFQGIEQYKYITIRGILIKSTCFLGVIAFVHAPDDYLVYAALVVLSTAIANLVNFGYMIRLLLPSLKMMKQSCRMDISSIVKTAFAVHIKPMLLFFVIAAAISIYTVLDTVMLGFLSSSQQVGFFTAAVNVKTALVGVVSALSGVLLPRASNMLRHNRKSEFVSLIKRCLAVTLAFAVPASAALSLFSTPLISWYAGADFAEAGTSLCLLSIAVIPISLSIIFTDAVLVPNGHEKQCVRMYIAAAVVNFLANLVLIPQFGAAGAAMSALCVELLLAIVSFALARKILWP